MKRKNQVDYNFEEFEEFEIEREQKNIKAQQQRKGKIFFWSCWTVSLIISLFALLFYGPFHGFRDFWITTAMTTKDHKYLATYLYDNNLIQSVLEANKVIEPTGTTNTNLIEIYDEVGDTNVYKDEYDKMILERESGALYKYIKLDEYSFDAYLVAIYDPSKISLVHTKYLGQKGQYLVDMAREHNAVVAINGSAFKDTKGQGNGGQPKGIIIENGKIIQATRNRSYGGGIIGFTNDNKLILGNMTAKEALAKDVRDAVEFGPYLVVNGKSAVVKGNGGYGIHPRSAIGQRQDGIVLFLVVDGRRLDSIGATIKDLADIMLKYGAYNAANLDGGNSSALVINNKLVNRPINWSDLEQTRPIATGFIVTE